MEAELLYPQTNKYRFEKKIDGIWDFKFDPEKVGVKSGWQSNLACAIKMPVPASFNDFFTDKDSREYTGDFWYQKDIFIPEYLKSQDIQIRFGAATHRVTVFFNGKKIRRHEGGFLPFVANVTDQVKFGESNRIVLKMNNKLYRDKLPVGDTITLKNGHKMAKPFFDFYNYSGLNRSVQLVAVPKQRILDYSAITQLISKGNAKISYVVSTNVPSFNAIVHLYDTDGNEVASSAGESGTLEVKNPHLWQVRKAYLYTIKFCLSHGDGQIFDEYSDEIGIRKIEIKGNRILVNNQSVYLKG